MEQLSPERAVYLSSLLLLSFCGVGVIGITSYCKVNKGSVQLALTRTLWKFESEANKRTIIIEKCWSWRKLVLAGLMMVSLSSTIFIKLMDYRWTLIIAGGAFSLWMICILAYWYLIVAPKLKSGTSDVSPVSDKKEQGEEESEAVKAWMSRKLDKDGKQDSRLPLTIITGFLGSGKTTLVKNILDNTVGMKVLVIENEIGAEGIDHELLMQHTAKEEIILMNNGCVCCTVRKDLLTTFHRMFSHEAFAELDWVVIETTGMADPAPLIQSLYMDPECAARLRLDSVLTVVDCKHLPTHLRTLPSTATTTDGTTNNTTTDMQSEGGNSNNKDAGNPWKGLFNISSTTDANLNIPEAVLQISFADVVLMNKTDLISEIELSSLCQSVQSINPSARLLACQHSTVPIEDLLNIRAFDPLQNPAFLSTNMSTDRVNNKDTAPMLIQVDANGKILHKIMKFGTSAENNKSKQKRMQSSPAGMKLRSKHKVNTVSLIVNEALDLDLFNAWITQLLQEHGVDIYRMKGILYMAGYEEQFVAHGVHMIFDGQRGRPWDDTTTATAASGSISVGAAARRYSRLVFIGLGLDQEALETGLLSCRAQCTS